MSKLPLPDIQSYYTVESTKPNWTFDEPISDCFHSGDECMNCQQKKYNEIKGSLVAFALYQEIKKRGNTNLLL